MSSVFTRRRLLLGGAAGLLSAGGALAGFPRGSATPFDCRDEDAEAFEVFRGVCSAGGEWGSLPSQIAVARYGVDWRYDSQESFDYLASRGHRVIRLVFLWERVQPRLEEDLDGGLLEHLHQALDRIEAAGMTTVLDMHNYGRYRLPPTFAEHVLGQGMVTGEHLADAWRQLALVFASHAGVHCYGLMNEPWNLSSGTPQERHAYWMKTSQQVVDAIRGTGDRTLIAVAGHTVSPGVRQPWDERFPIPWIEDPADNHVYEEHLYADADTSGTYAVSLAEETRLAVRDGHRDVAARTLATITPFVDWCREHRVRGYIGEFGVPTTGPDARGWADVADAVLDLADRTHTHLTWWATGELFGNYSLAPYVPSRSRSPVGVARMPAASVLEGHPSRPCS
jgi:endoglucanase